MLIITAASSHTVFSCLVMACGRVRTFWPPSLCGGVLGKESGPAGSPSCWCSGYTDTWMKELPPSPRVWVHCVLGLQLLLVRLWPRLCWPLTCCWLSFSGAGGSSEWDRGSLRCHNVAHRGTKRYWWFVVYLDGALHCLDTLNGLHKHIWFGAYFLFSLHSVTCQFQILCTVNSHCVRSRDLKQQLLSSEVSAPPRRPVGVVVRGRLCV